MARLASQPWARRPFGRGSEPRPPGQGRARAAALLLGLLPALAGCGGWPVGISLPGGPTRGSMTYDEAVQARDGLTRLDRLPAEAAPRR